MKRENYAEASKLLKQLDDLHRFKLSIEQGPYQSRHWYIGASSSDWRMAPVAVTQGVFEAMRDAVAREIGHIMAKLDEL